MEIGINLYMMPGTADSLQTPRTSGLIGRPDTLFTFVPAQFSHESTPISRSTSLAERMKSGLASDKGSYFGLDEPATTPTIASQAATPTHAHSAKKLPTERQRLCQRKHLGDKSPRSPRRSLKNSREKLSSDDAALVSAWNCRMAQGGAMA